MLLLDTHVLIWLDEGNHLLGNKTVSLLDKALQSAELAVAAISFWEVAMLINKSRLQMRLAVDEWRHSLIANGLVEVAMSGEVAIRSALLKDFHGDPADRMIVATAIQMTASLCTADQKILNWSNPLERLDARR